MLKEETILCEFCEIINKQRSAYIVFEGEKLVVFLDMDPIHEGHVLIIPKEHADSLDKIPEDVLLDVMRVAQKVVNALREIYGNPGYSIMQNGGKERQGNSFLSKSWFFADTGTADGARNDRIYCENGKINRELARIYKWIYN